MHTIDADPPSNEGYDIANGIDSCCHTKATEQVLAPASQAEAHIGDKRYLIPIVDNEPGSQQN